MMTTEQMSAAENNDAELVAGSLAGQRDAFRRIVERYQSLICSLAYCATGSLSQSEDLAQETFVAAWGHLAELREPTKLRAWLCGIARNRIGKALRRESREPAHAADPIEAAVETQASEPLPADHAISREEEAILWRSLERIPQTYREPLVLFYRAHQSIESVSAALGLSEDAVKQRLSRGRKLLHAQVLAFVEGALERTNPGKTFTAGVVAALPLLALQAKGVTLGTATIMAQGSVAKGAGLMGIIGAITAPIGAMTGGLFAIRGRIQNARSERERRFLLRSSWGILAWKALAFWMLLVAIWVADGVIINKASDAVVWSSVWIGLYSAWIAYSIWMNRRQMRIQIEDGTFAEATARRYGVVDPSRNGFAAIVYGGLATMIFGPGGLLLLVAGASGDHWVFGLLSLLSVAAWLACARAILERPERLKSIFATIWWGLALVTLATFNLRFHSWVNHPEHVWPENPYGFHLPPLWLNIPILAFYGSIGLGWWLQQRLTASPTKKV